MSASIAARKQPPVGIDLGTTYSLVAYLDDTGRPTTVQNRSGDLLTPSALFFDDDGVIVGKEAVKSAVLAADSYIECFKRDMGSENARRKVRDMAVPPEVLSAFVLQRLKEDAERRLGPISQVVITVPAFFDEGRRKATQEAGRLAGLEVLDIINEPTAAALAYGHQHGFFHGWEADGEHGRVRVMVYDLGGGTFDVTILEIEGNQFRALATDGDLWLGGKDFDERLVNYLAEQFITAHGVDPRSDPQDAAQLWMDAQEAKHTLSERSKTTVVCFHAGVRMRIEVTRAQFEEMILDLVQRTETTASLVLRQAGLDWPQIDHVLLVGGSSRIPMVAEMLRNVSGKEPDCSQSPDEAVAHGAALYAGMLMETSAPCEKSACRLVNVNSHSLGVVGTHRTTGKRSNVILIPKNSPLPCRATRIFKTAHANQPNVKIEVVEGESRRPEECIALGVCIVGDLPTGLPAGTPVEVEYAYQANGRISVFGRVPSVRYSRHVEIERNAGRQLSDLDSWRGRLRHQGLSTIHGVSPPSNRPVPQPLDSGEVLKRIDALYLEVGRLAASEVLPQPLSHCQQSALMSAAEVGRARTEYQVAHRARQAVPAGAEAIPLDARLAQAKAAVQQAQVRANFAHLALGREIVNANLQLPAVQRLLREIAELRKQLGGNRYAR